MVLADDAWETISESNKKAVINGTRELGINIGDVKTRIAFMLNPEEVGISINSVADPVPSVI